MLSLTRSEVKSILMDLIHLDEHFTWQISLIKNQININEVGELWKIGFIKNQVRTRHDGGF